MKMRNITQTESRLLIIITLLLILGGASLIGSRKKTIELKQNYLNEVKDQEALNSFFSTADNAKAVYVYDATAKKVLYEREADKVLPLASVTKLATALTALESMGDDKKITITSSALQKSGDNGLILGEAWRLDKLTSFMMVISSNDAAFAIKEEYEKSGKSFMQAMNDYGKKIGLEHTSFYDPAGLDNSGRPGAVGSAKDVSTLILTFLEKLPEIAKATILPDGTFSDLSGRQYRVSNTNDLSVHIDSLLASKTGYTALAGGNLAIAYRMPVYGDTIVIVILGSTREGRFVDIEQYMKGVENYFRISNK